MTKVNLSLSVAILCLSSMFYSNSSIYRNSFLFYRGTLNWITMEFIAHLPSALSSRIYSDLLCSTFPMLSCTADSVVTALTCLTSNMWE